LRTIYDQSGNSRHMIQATVGNQLQFLADCGDGRPCTRATLGSGQQLAFVSLASSATFTLSAVARTAVRGTGGCGFAYINNNTLLAHASLDTVILSNASVTINAAATTTAWHAYTGIWAGAASLMRVDATETTGNVAPLTSAISWAMYGGTGATCDEREWVLWDNYILTPAERAALQTNQKNFWGTP
jgi:hypothetical protein